MEEEEELEQQQEELEIQEQLLNIKLLQIKNKRKLHKIKQQQKDYNTISNLYQINNKQKIDQQVVQVIMVIQNY